MIFSAVILAGGKSRRMGRDKAQLEINDKSFLDTIAGELSGFSELLVSVDDAAKHPEIELKKIGDKYPGCGPMAGLHAALSACKGEALLAVSCDTPLFTSKLGEYLCSLLTADYDAVVPLTSDGREHPLCAVYRKSCADAFERGLESGNYRLRDALSELKVCYIDASDYESYFTNVNTPEDYEKLKEARNDNS